MRTIPGIFACGDVRFGPVKRIAASVGEGSMAIAFVHQYLKEAGWTDAKPEREAERGAAAAVAGAAVHAR